LSFTTGEFTGFARQKIFDLQQPGDTLDLGGDLFARCLSNTQRVGNVFRDCHVWVQCIVLEDHCQITMLRRNIVNALVVDENIAGGDLFETRQHSQCRRLPTAGWTKQHDKLAVLYGQREIVDHRLVAKRLGHIFEFNRH
jgi:hypothetical protein